MMDRSRDTYSTRQGINLGITFLSIMATVLRDPVSDLGDMIQRLPQLSDMRKLRVRGPYYDRSVKS